MKASEIKTGETYMLVATDAPARKSLEGKPFTVVEIKAVWRRLKKQSRRTKRFFNEDGIGARADELEPMPDRESPCDDCDTGEMKQIGFTQPNGQTNYECDKCGKTVSFP